MTTKPSLWCLVVHRLCGWVRADTIAVWCLRCGQRWPFVDATPDTAPAGMPQLFGRPPGAAAAQPQRTLRFTRNQQPPDGQNVVRIGLPSPALDLTFRLAHYATPVRFLSATADWLRVEETQRKFTMMVKLSDIHPDDRERVRAAVQQIPGTVWGSEVPAQPTEDATHGTDAPHGHPDDRPGG